MTVAKIQSRKFGKKEHYGDNWGRVSKFVREKSNWICSNCFKSFSKDKGGLHVHHLIPLSKGGNCSLANLSSLCRDCHALHHKHMRK